MNCPNLNNACTVEIGYQKALVNEESTIAFLESYVEKENRKIMCKSNELFNDEQKFNEQVIEFLERKLNLNGGRKRLDCSDSSVHLQKKKFPESIMESLST